jgi:hypothetical protein
VEKFGRLRIKNKNGFFLLVSSAQAKYFFSAKLSNVETKQKAAKT